MSPISPISPPDYCAVIPTLGGRAQLPETLASLRDQTHPPRRVILVDASPDAAARTAAEPFARDLAIIHLPAPAPPSAAKQRNLGAQHADTPLVAFIDDDITLRPAAAALACATFSDPACGGVALRIEGEESVRPRGLRRLYYRIQAGYDHPTYGGKLFGPGITCYPTYTEPEAPLIPAQWLNAGCSFYRTDVFLREKFPDFEGYSFMEDVHLSARIARTHRLFFHANASCIHRDGGKTSARDPRATAVMRIRNLRRVATEILGLEGPELGRKLLLHRLFVTAAILSRREPGWPAAIAGTWT